MMFGRRQDRKKGQIKEDIDRWENILAQTASAVKLM